MKLWWIGAVGLMCASSVASAVPLRDQIEVRDSDNAHYATIVFCNDCKSPDEATAKKPCNPGALDGWVDGKPCGDCLMKSNFGTVIKYPRDIVVTGTLVDKDGKLISGRFVKLFTPNGWGFRTKTSGSGSFRLTLGATGERAKGAKPLIVDVGQRIDSVTANDENFSLYLLPPNYAPCSGSKPEPAAAPKKK